MLSIVLFAEDYGHEEFVKSLVERLSRENGVPVKITPRNVRGGQGKVVTELQIFLRDLEHAREGLPDLLIKQQMQIVRDMQNGGGRLTK